MATSLRGHVRQFRFLGDAVLLAGAYYVLARIGLSFGSLPGNVAPVWPAGGFALAVLIVRGRRLWPGVTLGALAVYGVGADVPLSSALAMSAGNTLAALGAATVLGWIGFRPVFDRTRDVAALVVAATVGSAVSATIGTLSLRYGGLLAAADYWTTWRTWWMGDGLGGGVVVAPAVLAGFAAPLRGPLRPRLQFAGFLAIVAITGLWVIGPAGYPYLALPLVAWGAIRWALPGASLATLVTAVAAVVRVGQGAAPFAGSPTELLRLDGFLAVLSFSGLVVAAVVVERDAAAARLAGANRDLEERVRIRTAALDADRERLAEAQRIAGIGSWELDLGSETTIWSDEMYRIFGVDPSTFEPTYEAFLALVHPDDRATVTGCLDRALTSQDSFLFDYRVPLSDGRVRWVRARGRLVTDDAGNLAGMQGTCQDITDRMEAEASLTYHALHDPLTGLPNRTLLLDRIEVALARSARLGRSVAVLFLDLDRFKPINDSRGHATGDTVLQTVASRLRAAVRPSDTVGRLGGDEFVVVSEDASVWQATVLGERLIRTLEKPFEVEGDEVFVTVSVGIAIAETGVSADELLRDADVAMYQAKQRGRARSEFFDEAMRTEAARRLETATALHRALERDEFETHYQPMVDLNSGAIVGVEALVRWRHPERGLVSPAAFIPMAEEQGLIVPIGDRVLEESCRQWASWRAQFPARDPLILNVNISARQLHRPEFLESIRSVLASHGVDPGSLCLELTESVLMEDVEAERHTLSALRELGVGLAIDDFGTGYSSLTYLKRFPVSGIKIDQTFVAGLGVDTFDTAIIESVIELAHAVGLHVTAEGVETVEQMLRLRALGCDYAQGYYFARPQPAAALDALLECWSQAKAYTGS